MEVWEDMEETAWQGPARWMYALQLLACGAVLCSRIFFTSKTTSLDKTPTMARFTPSFLCFQRKFLSVFFLALVADGLQTVYGEALYESYGLKRREVALLLAIGHGSSLLLGTFLGASADYLGRKKACLIYGLLQVLGCLAKQHNNFKVLCFAHACLGLAGSLLFSAFEAWMTAEHEREWLSDTFWVMAFGSGVVGIGSVALANFLLEWQGFSGPATAVAATLCIVAISKAWGENTGNHYAKPSRPLLNAVQALQDKRVALLGWTQACFDLSISVFWLLWTPTLVADGREVQSGLIYARLMASMMLGSAIAALVLCGPFFVLPESYLPFIFILAGGSLILPAYDYQEIEVLVACFCVFHVCVGISWPSLARLRSIPFLKRVSLRVALARYIQNDRRAAVLSVYRIPVHVILLFIIIKGGLFRKLENSTIFTICILGLLSGAACLRVMKRMRPVSYESLVWKGSEKHPNI